MKTWADFQSEMPLTRGRLPVEKTAPKSDQRLFDELAVAVEAKKDAEHAYTAARVAWGNRRVERLAAGQEPENFGSVLSGLDAASQARREQVARTNAEIDGHFR